MEELVNTYTKSKRERYKNENKNKNNTTLSGIKKRQRLKSGAGIAIRAYIKR